MDIFLSGMDRKQFRLPLNPQKITVETGARVQTMDLMALGELEYPQGQKVKRVSWEGLFVGEARQTFSVVKDWKDPLEYVYTIADWRDVGTIVNLLIPKTPINMEVFVAEFEHNYAGGYGDVEYRLVLTEARELKVLTDQEWGKAAASGGKVKTRPKPVAPKTYTIKSGDNLYNIAKALLGQGTLWRQIYAANKAVIGNNPNVLKVGTVLRIPGGK